MFFNLFKKTKKEDDSNIKFETRGTLNPHLMIEIIIDKHAIGYINCIRRNGVCCLDEIKIYNEKDRGKGYGSKLLKKFIDFATTHDLDLIKGKICYENEKHKKKLVNFYKKFGFEIKADDEIIKKIKD